MPRTTWYPTVLRRVRRGILAVAGVLWLAPGLAQEIAPLRVEPGAVSSAADAGVYSERSLSLAIEIERDRARVVAFTAKERPYARLLRAPETERPSADRATVEVVLKGAGTATFTERFDISPICLRHPGGAEPHVEGDTITVHRDTVVIELPERAGLDRVEIAVLGEERGEAARRVLATEPLDRARFVAAGGAVKWEDVAFATESGDPRANLELTPGTVIWPESIPDPDLWRLWGDAAELDRRTTIVIVPDGYTYAEKGMMETHATQMVNYFRGITPYAQHDRFLNYVLVYAYSTESGTDQCDCGIVRDTAMSSRFIMSNPICGHSDNRCLFYGSGCDNDSSANIGLAEMRAPGFNYSLGDRTILMVNTTRYGGCGGFRAVYSAGNSAATEVAVHELGHSFAGLADEYEGNATCGFSAGEINTSKSATSGAWPEWIPETGAPRQGAQYYSLCLYRPESNCNMRSLFQPFCRVCNQRWSSVFYSKPRVHPTAPLAARTPGYPNVTAHVGVPAPFTVTTRFPTGAGVTNDLIWRIEGPGFPGPTVVASGVDHYAHTFSAEGSYTLTCDVIGATNFIKPAKWGWNRDVSIWNVSVVLPPPSEVSPPGSVEPLTFAAADTLVWESASTSGATTFNLYRGDGRALANGSYGACFMRGLTASTAADVDTPATDAFFFYLVAGATSGGEGPLGTASSGAPRAVAAPCPAGALLP